jgi:hypothetical protein
MVIVLGLVVLAVLTVLLFRHLRRRDDGGTLWGSAATIGLLVGVARAGLAIAGWYGLEHTAGVLQIPAYALALLALPEAMVFGRQHGPAPPHTYVFLGLLLVGTSLVLVAAVAFVVQSSRRKR